jgi:hypothetical protein
LGKEYNSSQASGLLPHTYSTPDYLLRQMPGKELSKQQIHELLIESLDDAVKKHSKPGQVPLELKLTSPLPSKLRLYLYNVSAFRDGDCKINVRLPSHQNGNKYAPPDRDEDFLVVLGGYDEMYDVFAFWDDTLYDQYREVQLLTLKETTLKRGSVEGIATQFRDGGKGGETVIVADNSHVTEALRMREQLVRIRELLNDLLPPEWRDNSKQGQIIEQVVYLFLEKTNPDQPTHERRESAHEFVAAEHAVEIQAIQEVTGRQLWKDPGNEGYHREYFDPVLDAIESVWKSEDNQLKSASDDILGKTTVPELLDNLGTDSPERRTTVQDQIQRNQHLVDALKALYDHKCQICDRRLQQGNEDGYSEVHHIRPLGDPHTGPDKQSNMLVLCPNHHADFDNGMIIIEPSTREITHLYDKKYTGTQLETIGWHELDNEHLEYHNTEICEFD